MNAAQSGGMARILPTDEVNYLKDRFAEYLKQDPTLQDSWKIVNILIGANDLCISCNKLMKDAIVSAEKYKVNLNQTMANLQAHFPKTIVAITEMFKVSPIVEVSKKEKSCGLIHFVLPEECQCAFSYFSGPQNRAIMDATVDLYNKAVREIAEFWNSKNLDGFGISVLPSLMNADLASENSDFISSVDCFHPSQLAHEYMAIHLWNNLLREPKERTSDFNLDEPILCPTEDSHVHIG